MWIERENSLCQNLSCLSTETWPREGWDLIRSNMEVWQIWSAMHMTSFEGESEYHLLEGQMVFVESHGHASQPTYW